jgi:hypothetical protein
MELKLSIIFFFMLSSLVFASPSFITSYSVFKSWIGILTIAIMFGILIASITYAAGIILNSSKIKESAVNEFGQLIGTSIIAVIIIAVIEFFGSASVTSLATNSIGNNINQICNNQLSNSQLAIVNSMISGSPTNTICSATTTVYQDIKNGNNGGIALFADYDLMSSYVVVANLTSQMANNLDALYKYEDYIGFLATLTPNTTYCVSATPAPPLLGAACIIPIDPRALSVSLSYTPYAGYSLLKNISKPLETQAYLIFEIYLVQLLIILMFLYAWPYLLAAGIILKAFMFTRKAGGMLIGIVIGALILYPIIFLFEYSALSSASISPIGASPSSIPIISLNGLPLNNNKPITYYSDKINFFVFPNATNVVNYYGCYPANGNIYESELLASSYFSAPAVGLSSLLNYGFGGGYISGIPSISSIAISCQPQNALSLIFQFADMYGIIGVTGYILPVINILILIAAIKGISQLMGGDTNLLGLGRFV